MKKSTYTIFILSILFVLSACEEETALPVIDELTVEAFLYAGETLDTITFGKVIPFDTLEATEAPNDLLPIVRTGDGENYELFYLGENGKYGNPDLFLEVGESYALEVNYNGQTITAETSIPDAPKEVTLTDNSVEMTQINDFTDIFNQEPPDPIQVDWNNDDGGWYFVQVQNIEEDPEPINQLFIDEDIDFERPTFVTEPTSDPFYLINVFRDITHFGTYEVTVFRVNAEYVALYEDNTESSGSLNEIRTNVQNGFGIFTGVNSTSILFEVRKR